MKKLLFNLVVALGVAGVLAGCHNNSVNTISNAGVNAQITRINDLRVNTDSDLAEDIVLTEIRESHTNDGYMRVQVFLKNATDRSRKLTYRFNWYDNAGAEVDNPDQNYWERIVVVAGDDITLTSVAPQKVCRDFKLRLKALD